MRPVGFAEFERAEIAARLEQRIGLGDEPVDVFRTDDAGELQFEFPLG